MPLLLALAALVVMMLVILFGHPADGISPGVNEASPSETVIAE